MRKLRTGVLSIICIGVLLLGVMPVLAVPAEQGDEPVCQEGWASLESVAFPGKFTIWATCTGAYAQELREMRSIVERFWGPMTEFMGIEPIPDEGTESAGGDSAIDFYLADQETGVPQRGVGAPGPQMYGYARPTAPFVGVSSSGFVVMRREMLGDPQFIDTLTHEFFHVLQQARNARLTFNWNIRPDDDPEWDTLVFAEPWWVEGTAEWAGFRFTRDLPDQDSTRLIGHHQRFSYFLSYSSDVPLHAPQQRGEAGWAFMYSTYIWFHFMEQEIGPEAVAEIWKEFAGLGPNDTEQAMAIIDAKLPFEQHFRDFAVRNLNLALQPGDPIDPSYDDLDPAFPIAPAHNDVNLDSQISSNELTPPLVVGEDDDEAELPITSAGDEPRRFPDRLRSLTAHYYRFVPDPNGAQLLLDFSGFAPAADLDVDALVKVEDGEWERRQLAAGGSTTFCLSNPEDAVEEFYLILSNHNRDLFSVVEGEFTAQVLGEQCAA